MIELMLGAILGVLIVFYLDWAKRADKRERHIAHIAGQPRPTSSTDAGGEDAR
jgi:hypothetical protein